MRPPLNWLRALTGLLLVLLALWIATIGLILWAGMRPRLRRADAILVLGAAQYNGKPSPVLRARLDHALMLYQRGYAPMLVLTGGVGRGDSVSEGEVARRYAVHQRVPAEAILVDRTGMTTRSSIAAAAQLMKANGLHSALIVSDSYHMLRVELLARRAGLTPYRAPAPNSPIDRAQRQRWFYILRESVLFPVAAFRSP